MPSMSCKWKDWLSTPATPATPGLALKTMGASAIRHMWRDPRCLVYAFLESLFSRWGLPQTITTDNGTQFVSVEFTSYLENRGIRHIRTALYHPQANGRGNASINP